MRDKWVYPFAFSIGLMMGGACLNGMREGIAVWSWRHGEESDKDVA